MNNKSIFVLGIIFSALILITFASAYCGNIGFCDGINCGGTGATSVWGYCASPAGLVAGHSTNYQPGIRACNNNNLYEYDGYIAYGSDLSATCGCEGWDLIQSCSSNQVCNASVGCAPVIPTNQSQNNTNAPFLAGFLINATNSTAIFSWDTDIPSNSSLNYGLTQGLGTIIPNSSFSLNHSQLISSLSANATYFYNLTACSNSSNCTALSGNFTTLSDLAGNTNDITPPGAITNFSYTATNNSVSMAWANPIDSDFNGTLVLLNNVQIAILNKTTSTYTITGLNQNTTYNVTISTIDTSGNTNSSMYSVTTASGSQIIPPVYPPVYPPYRKDGKTQIFYGSSEEEIVPQQIIRGQSIGNLTTVSLSDNQASGNYWVFVLFLALLILLLSVLIILVFISRRR